MGACLWDPIGGRPVGWRKQLSITGLAPFAAAVADLTGEVWRCVTVGEGDRFLSGCEFGLGAVCLAWTGEFCSLPGCLIGCRRCSTFEPVSRSVSVACAFLRRCLSSSVEAWADLRGGSCGRGLADGLVRPDTRGLAWALVLRSGRLCAF